MLGVDLYKSLLRNIEAEFEARRRTLENERRKAIEALNEAWPKMGGSEQDLISVAVEEAAPSPVEKKADDQPQAAGEDTPMRNGDSSGRVLHMATIREEVLKALSDMESDIVTQTDLKERILEKYPDANIARAAAAISRCLTQLTDQGELELVERGIARTPHKYRKTRKGTEVNLLGP